MADAVTTRTVSESPDELCIHLTNISDGTGEAAAIKCDKSTFLSSAGIEPVSVDVLEVRWNIQGFTSIRFLWDHTTDDTAMALSGSGYDDFRGADSYSRAKKGLADPRSAGDTGDLLLTTAGAVSGATYDITLRLKKSPQ